MRYPILSLLFLFLCCMSVAQVKPQWQVQEPGFIWMRTTTLGNLIVSTSSGLKGIDPQTGKITWNLPELASVPEKNFQEIANTPFIAITATDNPDHLYILEPFEGKVMFDSKNSNISKISNRYFMYENNCILISGIQGSGEPVLAGVDMQNGKLLWTKTSDFSRITACLSANGDDLILSTLFFAYRINARTGEEMWKQAVDPSFEKMSGLLNMLDKGGANLKDEVYALLIKTEFAPGLVFMAAQKETKKEVTGSDGKKTTSISYSSYYNAFDISNGAYAWEKPVQINQKLGVVIPAKTGLVVCAGDKSDVNLLDYKSGFGTWGKNGKGTDVKGGAVSGAVLMDDHILLTSGNKDHTISYLEISSGINRFPKGVKVSGITEKIITLPQGFIIATNEAVDFINSSDGESYIGKEYSSKPGLISDSESDVFIFNSKDGNLYAFEKNKTTSKIISASPVTLEGKETAERNELIPAGILISASQNMVLFDTKGNKVYQKYFPAPRESGIRRALLYASAARAAYYTAVFGYTSAVFGAVSTTIRVEDAQSKAVKDITNNISGVYGNAAKAGYSATSQFMAAANRRFTATRQSNESMYILTEAGKKEYKLLKVSKATGETMGEIDLGQDKEPQYALDAIDNMIYYRKGDEIIGYKL